MARKSNSKRARELIGRNTQHGLSKQAAKEQQRIASVGTERNHAQGAKMYLDWCQVNGVHPDRHANRAIMSAFLQERAEVIQQKQLDTERKALQWAYHQQLPRVTSLIVPLVERRSYSWDQVAAIVRHQTPKNALPAHLAIESGLRAHEFATLMRIEERAPSSHRTWDERLFCGRSGTHQVYTVKGKGGLIRAVAIPDYLATELEARRMPPKLVRDREIIYLAHYDLGFGHALSQSFSDASRRTLGVSTGFHGLRHSFAKIRLCQLLQALKLVAPSATRGEIIQQAMLILSQELGHFRPDITLAYLR